MIRSMTGFGRGAASNGQYEVSVELSAVNRKQAEFVVQLPRELAEFEVSLRQMMAGEISRGRVQMNISYRATASLGEESIDREAVVKLERQFWEISRVLGRTVEPQAADFLRNPEIFVTARRLAEPEKLWSLVEDAAKAGLEKFCEMRAVEGAHLQKDLEMRLGLLECLVEEARKTSEQRPKEQRDALLRRLKELGLELLDLSDERLLKELAFAADRCDITEEMTRLGSHLAQFYAYLQGNEPSGRSLDFLCQEIHRELNTIASKANDANLAQTMVKAKTELEKIREQVQNVE